MVTCFRVFRNHPVSTSVHTNKWSKYQPGQHSLYTGTFWRNEWPLRNFAVHQILSAIKKLTASSVIMSLLPLLDSGYPMTPSLLVNGSNFINFTCSKTAFLEKNTVLTTVGTFYVLAGFLFAYNLLLEGTQKGRHSAKRNRIRHPKCDFDQTTHKLKVDGD